MENKNEQLQQFLENNPNASKATISEGIDMKGLPLFNLLKKMLSDGIITEEGEGDEKSYSLVNVDESASDVVEEVLEVTAEVESDTENRNEQPATEETAPPAEQTENLETEEVKSTKGRCGSRREYHNGELADMIDKSHGFIGKVENPKHRAKYNIALLNDLAKALECSIKDFFPDKPL